MAFRTEIPIVVLHPTTSLPVNNAPITVYNRNADGTRGSAATVYQSANTASSTTFSNPGIQTDSSGRVTGWLARGRYEVVITVAGFPDYSEYIESAPGGDGDLDTAWLADSAVTNAKLAANAVTTDKITDGTIVNADVSGSAAITYGKLSLTGGIVNADINSSAAIAHSKLANSTAGQILLGNGSGVITATTVSGDVTVSSSGVTAIGADKVTNVMLRDDAVTDGNRAVTTDHIRDAAVTTAKINDSAVTSAKIADGAIVNADINSSAAIAYSKLALTGTVVNADISASAAIAYSKLSLAGSIVNADVASSAAIAYSKLSLAGSIVNADIASGAAIAYSKLSLTGAITNADLAGSISFSKLATTTAGNILVANGSGVISSTAMGGDATISTGGSLTIGADAISTSKIAANAVTLAKFVRGTSGHILIGQGASDTSYNAVSGDVTMSSTGVFTVSNSAINANKIATDAVTTAKILNANVTTAKIADQNVTLAKVVRSDTAGHILIGQGTSADTAYTAVSGDVTISSSGVTTIGPSKVTNSMLAGSIAHSKLATSVPTTHGVFLMGAPTTGVITPMSLSGDISVSPSGVVTVAGISGASIGNNAIDETKLSFEAAGSILIGQGLTTNSAYFVPSGDITMDTSGVFTIGANKVDSSKLRDDAVTDGNRAVTTNHIRDAAITNAKVLTNTLTPSKIARDTAGTILIAKGAGADVAFTSVSGDISIDSSGVTSITLGSITNADINASAGIVRSKLDFGSGLVNSDIATSAAIALSKLATDPLARANHTGTQTASTISNFDTQVRTSRLDQMAVPTSSVSLNSQKIINLATPTLSGDAATKQYVDDRAGGLDWHGSVVAKSTANVNTSTPGSTLDGVTLTNGDRILLTDQSTASQNGIWVWNGSTSALTRPADADEAGDLSGGSTVFVEGGTTWADSQWSITTNGSVTPGTTAHTWTQTNALGQITVSAELTKTGNQLSVTPSGITNAMLAGSIATSKITGFDTQVRTNRLDQMAAPTGSVSMNSQKVTGLAAATANGDAVRYEQLLDAVPSGTIIMYGGAAAPTGYLLCNGAEVARASYTALDAVIGPSFGPGGAYTNGSGGAGTTHLKLPDFRNKFPKGKNSEAIGTTGGSTTIGTSNLPSHSHTLVSASVSGSPGLSGGITGGGSHSATMAGGITSYSGNTNTGTAHAHTYNSTFGTRSDLSTGGSATAVIGAVAVATSYESGHYHNMDHGHSHNITATVQNHSHTHDLSVDVGSLDVGGTTDNTGSGTDYWQPYVSVNYIIKT